MNETDLLNPDIEVKMNATLYFDPDVEVKTVDIEVRMKPPGQILVERFYFYPVCLKNPPISRQGNALPLRLGSYFKQDSTHFPVTSLF